MKVLGIGYGRHLFDTDTFEFQRLQSCANAVESFDHIVFTHKKDDLKKLTVGNFTIHPTNSNSRVAMVFDAVRIGKRIIQDKNISVISAQDVFETGFVGWRLKRIHKNLTLQVQEHGDVLSSKQWRKEKLSNQLRYWFAFVVLREADVVRVVSARTQTFLQEKLGKNKKIHSFPVVIDIKQFADQQHVECGSTDTFTFITAARFVPQKNFPLMIRAFAAACKNNSELRLKIFGEGYLESRMRELVNSLGISDVVEINGWTTELGIEMQKADAYLLTSNYEGWARVLIEAMVLQLPVVTTDVGCVGEVLLHSEHGIVVPVDDFERLTAAIEHIATDRDLYAGIQQNLAEVSLESLPGTNIETYPQDWALTLQ